MQIHEIFRKSVQEAVVAPVIKPSQGIAQRKAALAAAAPVPPVPEPTVAPAASKNGSLGKAVLSHATSAAYNSLLGQAGATNSFTSATGIGHDMTRLEKAAYDAGITAKQLKVPTGTYAKPTGNPAADALLTSVGLLPKKAGTT